MKKARSFLKKRTKKLLSIGAALMLMAQHAAAEQHLLNVSYDPTREFYADVAKAFTAHNPDITLETSNGGSGAQARSVLEGLQADVVTLALASDIDALANAGLLAKDWATRLPDNSVPYTSTIVFLVRHGNPRHIKDWPDLIRPGTQVITSNPKTSGGARWAFLAALGWAQRQTGATEASTTAYMRSLYQHVPVLDTGARGATTTFAQRGIGDVLIAWENEALLASAELGKGAFDIVIPSISVRAEPPVAVVDSVVDAHHSRAAAEALLNFLYTPEGQELAAKHFYRPRDAAILAKYAGQFPTLPLVTIADFGGWPTAQKSYFADGGLFDHITGAAP